MEIEIDKNQTATRVSDVHLVGYSPGAEANIIHSFNSVFETQRSLSHWRWKFLKNPYASPTLSMTMSNRQLLSHYAVIPLYLNLKGRPLLIGQSVDLFVRPECRGKGIYLETANHCYRQCEEKHILGVYGFPNEAAYPARVGKLKSKPIFALRYYVLKLSYENALARVIKPKALAIWMAQISRWLIKFKIEFKQFSIKLQLLTDFRVYQSQTCPEQIDELWAKVKLQNKLGLWKDFKYFQWRYDQHPDQEFRYFSMYVGGALRAIAVVNLSGELIRICELMVLNLDVSLGRFLLLEIARHFNHDKANTLSFKGFDQGYFDKVFQDFSQRSGSKDVFCFRLFDENSILQDTYEKSANWSITLGDSDAI